MRKKGFELSINFIVVIVLAIVVFGLGIFMLNRFLGGASEIKMELDERTDTQLSNLLQAGNKVVIPFNSATIPRGDYHVFGLGILNSEQESNFNVVIDLSRALDKNDIQMARDPDIEPWLRYDKQTFKLSRSEQRKDVIRVDAPRDAASGTYILNVNVYRNGEIYGGIVKKIYITVP